MGLLRFILALSVVIAHVPGLTVPVMTGGAVSVQCFYIISGFLIAMILNEKYVGPSDKYLFYSNRFLRIFPLYWMFLALALVVGVAAYAAAHKGAMAIWHDNWSRLSPIDVSFLTFTNLLLFGQDQIALLRLGGSGLEWTTQFYVSDPEVFEFLFVPQGWSLSLELAFYLLAPFIVRRSVWTIGLVAVAGLAGRTAAHVAGLQFDPWSYRFFPFELPVFLAGVLSYRLGESFKGAALPRIAKISAFGIIPAVILFPLYDSGAAIFFTVSRIGLYAYLVVALPMLYRLTKDANSDRIAGDLSYPIYLCHLIPIQLLQGSGILAPHAATRAVLAVAWSVVLAAVATRFVEIPLNKFRQYRILRASRLGRAEGRAFAKASAAMRIACLRRRQS
jgi:peptidoglycan/LPS O-acetylase OafA/YrhL